MAVRTALSEALAGEHGVVALDGSDVVGALTFTGPFHPFHGDHCGVLAGLHTSAVRGDDRDATFTEMFRTAAAHPDFAAVDTWTITTYTHDGDLARGRP
ncbi:hypothetical protein [Aestuariimicrobium ganziense]|uniref:hypothetical protein n=1 Tax=Aestuariimicrobium ganziense TaxID=2773677 RepID=UPI00194100BA|nr:hypothetical protein [Aestuariimicrobium ganziense]